MRVLSIQPRKNFYDLVHFVYYFFEKNPRRCLKSILPEVSQNFEKVLHQTILNFQFQFMIPNGISDGKLELKTETNEFSFLI